MGAVLNNLVISVSLRFNKLSILLLHKASVHCLASVKPGSENKHIPQVEINQTIQRKIVNIFLSINFNMCFGCSKELSHCDSYFEYPQHNVMVVKYEK